MIQADSPIPPGDEALAARIVAVVPVLNEAGVIEPCLLSLLGGSPALTRVQILVMDGGSTDGTLEMTNRLAAGRPAMTVHHNPRRMAGAGVNEAARLAEPGRDILIRCDAHALYPEDYLLRVARALLKNKADSLVVPMDARARPGAGCFANAQAWVADSILGAGGAAHRGGTTSGAVDHGHHAGFLLDRFTSLSGYDETLPANEDAEYDTRLRQAGGRIWLDASIRMIYYPRENFASLWRQYWRYGRGRAIHMRRHRVKPRLRQLVPVGHVLLLALSAAWLPVSVLGLAYPLFYAVLVGCFGIAMTIQHRSLCGLLSPMALFAMHTAWGLGFLEEIILSERRKP